MTFLDMRTMTFSYWGTVVLCTLVIVSLWYQSRKRFAGISFWVVDFVFQAAALVLIVLRGAIPDWMSIVLANTLVIVGAILGLQGLERFVGKRGPQIHNYLLVTLFIFVHGYFSFVQPSLAVRSLNIAVALLLVCFQAVWLLWRRVEPGLRSLTFGVGLVNFLYCLVSVFRIVKFFIEAHAENDYFLASTAEMLVLVSYQMLFLLLTYSFVLMVNQRLLDESATLAIENARLFQDEQKRQQLVQTVRAVGEEIIRELDLPTLLDLITRHAAGLVGANSGTVWLWDERAGMLIPAASHGLGDWMTDLRLRLGEGIPGTVAQRREGLIVNDYRTSPLAKPAVLERTPVTAVLAEPLLYRDRLLGALTVGKHDPGSSFTEEDQEILRLFTTQAAIAIENARLHSAAVRRGEQLEALLRATRSVMSGLDLQRVLDQILTEAAGMSACPHVKIFLVDQEAGALRVAAFQGMTVSHVGSLISLGSGLTGLVGQTGQPVFSEDLPQDPRNLVPEQDRALGLVAYLGLPIKLRDEVLGVLTFRTTAPRHYPPDEVAYLTAFADQAAIAIENARLFAELNQSFDALQQAQGELIRTEKLRALGQMAAGIAHDLNNILMAIVGQVELLKLQAETPDLRTALDSLETAALDGAHIVRTLQDSTRSHPTGPQSVCDLAGLVRETVALTRPRWKDEPEHRGVTIAVRTVLPDLPPIQGHPAEIREALTNVILNAVDAMPAGGTLTLAGRLAPATEDGRRTTEDGGRETGDGAAVGLPSPVPGLPSPVPGQWIELTVTDTGTGMPAEVQRQIFDPFFTTKGGHGTGLGLSRVVAIMARHRGRVDVVSALGEGTTFLLHFPVAPGSALALPLPAAVGEARPVPGRRLLFVEDDPVVRKPLAGLLRAAGHTVTEADGGTAALALLAAQPVDLVSPTWACPNSRAGRSRGS